MVNIRWVSDIINFRVLSSGISGVSITILGNHQEFSLVPYSCMLAKLVMWHYILWVSETRRVLTIIPPQRLCLNLAIFHIWSSGKHLNKWTTKAWTSSFSYSLHTDHITKSFAHKTKRAPMKPEDPGERKPHGWEQMGRIINLERWENLEVALMKHITGTPIYYAYSSLPLVLIVFLNASSTSTYLQSKCTAS